MNDLPDELLQHIFTFLSQRYVASASLVCKKWLVLTRNPQFYKTIIIYSTKQLRKFLNIATTLKITKNNTPVGYFVYSIKIDNTCSNIMEQLESLYCCCPNVKNMDGLPSDSYFPWPTLTTIPYRFTLSDRSLSLHKQHNIIISLSFTIEPENNNNNNHLIQVQKDLQKRYRPVRKMNDSLFFLNNEETTSTTNQDEHLIECYGYTIFFLSPSSWTQLKILYLDFQTLYIRSDVFIYGFDERVLDVIRTTCPQLESLILEEFFMNISDDYRFKITSSSTTTTMTRNINTIYPHTSLKQLRLNNCALNDILCFDYFSKHYPNTTDLDLILLWNGYDNNGECENYKLSLFNMITGFTCLKKLSASIKNENNSINLSIKDKVWPSLELYQWFMDHPTQLKELDYPFDLLTIENDYLKQLQPSSLSSSPLLCYQQNVNLNRSLAYIRHLTSLTLRLENNISQILDYLQSGDSNNHVSLSLTSLTINKDEYRRTRIYSRGPCNEENDFFIDQWLNAFPNLKEMKLLGFLNIKKRKKEKKQEVDDPQQQQCRTAYALKELSITGAFLDMTSDLLKGFFESCPTLRILKFCVIDFLHTTKNPVLPYFILSSLPPIKDENGMDYMIIDIPHLHLDTLSICYLRGEIFGMISVENTPIKLMVNQIGLKNTFEVEKHTTSLLSAKNIVVNCKSVDNIHFFSY
ncbi:unnamed protein product [Cunninghamella echinulata]